MRPPASERWASPRSPRAARRASATRSAAVRAASAGLRVMVSRGRALVLMAVSFRTWARASSQVDRARAARARRLGENPRAVASEREDEMASITGTPEWRALEAHHRELRDVHLRDLFAADPGRGEAMAVEAADLYLDYAKHRVTAETIRLLVAVAERAGLRERIDAMFRGERINVTEDRAVLHVALRAPEDEVIEVDGQNVVPLVHAVLRQMSGFAERVRSGAWTGHTGKRIRNVINVGIGGIRPRPGDGLRGAQGLLGALDDVPVRVQRRRRRPSGRPRTTSTRPRRSSSSPPRPSPRWRR